MYRKTVEELQKDQREKLVIDIRSEQDYIKETYPGAKHIFWEEFMEHIGEIPKELPVYLFCYTGQRSDEIAEDLSEQGYEIYSIEGGYRSYLRKKLADFMKEDDGTAERLADKAADQFCHAFYHGDFFPLCHRTCCIGRADLSSAFPGNGTDGTYGRYHDVGWGNGGCVLCNVYAFKRTAAGH